MKIIGMYDPYDLQIIIDNSKYELHFILIVWQLDIDGHVAPAAVPESLFCLGLNISKAKLNLKLKFLLEENHFGRLFPEMRFVILTKSKPALFS